MRDLLNETSAVKTLFSNLLSGAILLVSIVVSINSVVLSQEITDLESQQDRIAASLEYHNYIEDFIEADITPARPADFLNAVLYAVSRHVQSLAQFATDNTNDEYQKEVEAFADQVAEDIEQARYTLTTARFGSIQVLLAGLNYNYSGQLHTARGLKRTYESELRDEEQEAIATIIDILTYIGTGREYFKSLYYKQELARLSSRLLIISLPVIVFTSYVLLALDASLFPDISVFGVSPLLLFITSAYTIALAPYIILTAYIMRAATITLRTLAAGPFILQEGGDIGSLGWNSPSSSCEWEKPSREWELTERTDDD
ncbi:hypothetical protein [Halocatena salina]|uniref:Uncharacterized protein n=1 Tax=Halocatena salina TaxID=2934340 RepID=A0A8U0A636_9EURY|nr:hypothetical protein [Halocatena salina]UPM44641.1 hypothetical protein MW046_16505 [Halocatena salina]